MSTTIVPIITTVSNNISNITNITHITHITHNEKTSDIPMEVYILLLIILGLVGLSLLVGLQECARVNHYNNFIQCMVCEFSTIILSCFVGDERSINILSICGGKKNNTRNTTRNTTRIRQRTYSDTESEYSDDGYYPSKDTVITIEPSIMFVSEMPQLYLENNKDKKICSICCEELNTNNTYESNNDENSDNDNSKQTENNEIDFKETENNETDFRETENNSEETENNPDYDNINNIVKLECGHFYHSQCIEPWYKTSKNKDCPMCKSEIKVEDYYFT
jgi:hypothetical protein